MKKFIILVCLVILNSAFSYSTENRIQSFVKIRNNRELYVDYMKTNPEAPTAILLNGLTYSTKQWDDFANELVKLGVNVLRYDPFGMGQTLLKYAPMTEVIKIEEQAKDLNDLANALNINSKLNLVGLSYGGGLAMVFAQKYPAKVNKLILMAPFTQPVEEQDKWIRSQIWFIRNSQPWNKSTDDDLYDFFLKTLVYTTYPIAEPLAIENPFKLEGVYRMVQGIRKWKSEMSVQFFPEESTHLIIAGRDQYIKRQVLDDFWISVPSKARASYMVIANAEHKIPEDVPKFSASWVFEILSNNRTIVEKQKFEGDPKTGVVKYEGGNFKIHHD